MDMFAVFYDDGRLPGNTLRKLQKLSVLQKGGGGAFQRFMRSCPMLKLLALYTMMCLYKSTSNPTKRISIVLIFPNGSFLLNI